MIERQRIQIQGIVQGVGFRPFVYGMALRCGLAGFVLNDSQGVTIEVEGDPAALRQFDQALRDQLPPLARIDSLHSEDLPPQGDTAFVIAHSQAGAERQALIAPDSATCDECLAELLDPADRRFGYPFINCTNCGPRFTIVQDVPYDRAKTTMRAFVMCPRCRAEYEDPLDRRFHAQPNACPTCGPAVSLLFPSPARRLTSRAQINAARLRGLHTRKPRRGFVIKSPPPRRPGDQRPADPIAAAAHRLAAGAILAIKGLGGYHLACDALDPAAVARLRARKHREARPFALMAPDLATARQVCHIDEAEAALLASRRRPIVLLRRADTPAAALIAPAVAPGADTLGVMLPYTPLHHLLLRAFAAAAPGRPALLVMTSGNLSDEPIAYRDDDARERLAPLGDGTLSHNRPIHMRCDDSVVRAVHGGPQIFRRSRGYAPEPIELAFESPTPLLATGGHLKNTFCLLKGRRAFLSHHIGDLENLETLTSFREGIAHFQRLFDIAPQAVAYDLHPEYLATKEALGMDLPQKIGVQHHHAHIAGVLAEHGRDGPVIGVAADGTGYGEDGAIWGCEIMRADLRDFTRLAHLRYAPLPGGDQAVRQPWRVAAAYIQQAYGDGFLDLDIPFVRQLDPARWRPLRQMIARRLNSPPASSLGRLFDAAAALIGLRQEVSYEGQAAIELERIAAPDGHVYPFHIAGGDPAVLDPAPMLRAIVADLRAGLPAALIAGRFHTSVAALLETACEQARQATGLGTVALSGGVFQNRLLLELLIARLERRGFAVLINRLTPPNDGGLSLGQIAVAAARLRSERP